MHRVSPTALLLALWPATAFADGGPDDFGYTWTDSLTGSATWAWVDIRQDPRAVELLLHDDEASEPIDIGFPFSFYDRTYERVRVHADGFLAFEPVDDDLADLHVLCAGPRAGDVDGAIYFYARDNNPLEGGTIHVLSGGAEPNRTFVVQLTAVPLYADEGGLVDVMTVQALLHEGTNDVDVMVQETDDRAGGNGLVGLESPDGLAGLAYQGCLVDGSLPDETAIHFSYPSTDLAAWPRDRRGAGEPDEPVHYPFTIHNLSDAEATLPISVASDWTVTTAPADQAVVAAGASVTLDVSVNIPAEATPGQTSEATVTITASDTIELTIRTGVQRASKGDWQRVADLPRANDQFVVGVTDEALFVAGGRTMVAEQYVPGDSMARYDVATNRWTTADDGDLSPMPDGRFLAMGCALDGHLYVIGGFTTEIDPEAGAFLVGDTTFDYDVAADVWTEAAALPEPRMGGVAVCDAFGAQVFVFGGYTADGDDADDDLDELLDVIVFDPATDAWTAAGTLTAPRSALAAAQIDASTIVLAGGFYAGLASAAVEAYDVASGTFSALPSLPDARAFGVGVAEDGEMCVASGAAAGKLATDWLCLSDVTWIVQADALPTPVLPSGGGVADARLYVVAGQDDQGELSNAVQRWPPAPLPDGDADADTDAGTDGGTDGDADGDAGADGAGHGDGGGCCTVAPGTPAHDRSWLVALGALLFGATLLSRARSSEPRRPARRPLDAGSNGYGDSFNPGG